MKPLKTDLSVYRRFNFERPPVGVKFLPEPPGGMEQMQGSMALCEMVNHAQETGAPFYAARENEDCAGAMVLGMVEPRPMPGGGELGVRYGIFENPEANEKLIAQSPKMEPGLINCVAFAPLDRLDFEPDLLFVLADANQAEILLRAMSYVSGELWQSQVSSVGACTWMFAYPHQSGKVNYVTTGITFGLKARRVYPAGRLLFSLPHDAMAGMAQNLTRMEWELPSYKDKTREEFLARRGKLFADLAREFGGA